MRSVRESAFKNKLKIPPGLNTVGRIHKNL